ncbi:hypothetical protein AMK27_36020 [Streptomyces sp. CB02009]|uniref:hypothetical protein n=1 Tax=Streptomyces sp. CB02009 TaxID=1703938 RepID=UPI00093BB6A4|nr:hypothetical protein [Streptomyces sp. CB02009]OKJ49485.1 hypothetical protein AMK27_36020 [Streptomyces sp. CB02009]
MELNVDASGRPWTLSGGGPVIVIPAEIAGHWRGTLPPVGVEVPAGWTWGGSSGPECDYDRACSPGVYEPTPHGGFGWVGVQETPVLILDGEILTWFEAGAEGGSLVRSAIDEADGDPEKVFPGSWRSVGVDVISLTDGRLYMFDSAAAGAVDPAQIAADDGVGVITLGAGNWRVEFATDADECDFVRFRRP